MKLTCDACGSENGSCNRYLLSGVKEITVCPTCLAFGSDDVSLAARRAHKAGLLIDDNNKMKGKKR